MPAFLVELRGVPRGGGLRILVTRGGNLLDVTVEPSPDGQARHVAETAARAVRAAAGGGPETADHAGRFVLIRDVDDVMVESRDDALAAIEYPVTPAARLAPIRLGFRKSLAPAPAPDPDEQTLGHLRRMVGALSRSARAEARLLRGLTSLNRTYLQAQRALVVAKAFPGSANPGPGGVVAIDPRTAQRLLGDVGDYNGRMGKALGMLADARAAQLKAVEGKEREAKGNKPGGGGAPSGTGGSAPAPTSSSGGAPAPSSQPRPANGDSSVPRVGAPTPQDPVVGKPAGTEEETETFETPCQFTIYDINGLKITVGQFPDGDFVSLDQRPLEVVEADGTTRIIPDAHWFGDFQAEDPAERPVRIDKAALDAYVEELKREARAPREVEGEGWLTPESVISIGLDLLPIIGDLKGIVEGISGRELLTGKALSPVERALSIVGAVLPFAGDAIAAGTRAALRGARETVRAGRALTEAQLAALRTAQEALERARQANRGKNPLVQVNRCSLKRDSTVARVGRTLDDGPCFAAGTGVHLPDGSRKPIERLEVGDSVLTRESRHGAPRPAPGRVVATRAHHVAGTLALWLQREGATERIRVTARHPFATPEGWVEAQALRVGDEILCVDGAAATVASLEIDESPVTVHNVEVSPGHAYYIGGCGALVHNWCEDLSITHLERLLDAPGSGLRRDVHPSTGRPIREPGYQNGVPLNRGNKQAYYTKQLGNSTFPDSVATRVADGKKVALEMKTPDRFETVGGYFSRPGVQSHVLAQHAGRLLHLPRGTEKILVVDLRQCKQSIDEALEDLSRVLSGPNSLYAPESRNLWDGVQFLTGTADTFSLSGIKQISLG